MKVETIEQQKREGGFTLVELAIVMIIIGLLIGGILKGQELIANSQVTATIAQVKSIDAATSTFRDKYNALPGDMNNATVRLGPCAAGTTICADGRGNGRIDGRAANQVPRIADEKLQAFVHLAAGDLLSGVDTAAGTAAFGSALPDAKAGGGFWIAYTANGVINTVATNAEARAGHYLVYTGVAANLAAGNGAVQPGRAAQIDRKLDDGAPGTGSVISNGTACRVNAGAYNEGAGDVCNMAIRVQG